MECTVTTDKGVQFYITNIFKNVKKKDNNIETEIAHN